MRRLVSAFAGRTDHFVENIYHGTNAVLLAEMICLSVGWVQSVNVLSLVFDITGYVQISMNKIQGLFKDF